MELDKEATKLQETWRLGEGGVAGMGGSPTGKEGVQRPDVSSEMPTDP